MKKFLPVIVVAGMLAACSSNDATVDPANRVSETIVKYTDVLKGAPAGWHMTYYGNTDFGGYNILCRFGENGAVTIANEQFKADTTATSHYRLEQSGGIILSFDEYNELFHYFSDPVNPDGFGRGTADGFGGDLEFRVISASADSVVLRGKKHQARVVMTPLQEGTDWAQYLTQVKTVAQNMQKGSYDIVVGSERLRVKASKSNRTLTYYTTDEEGNRTTHTLPYTVTPQGITLYEPFTYAGQTVTGFAYEPDTDVYKQYGGGGVTLEKMIPKVNELLVEEAWFVTKDGLGSFATRYWNQFRSGMLNTYNLVIWFGAFGTWRNHFGLSVGVVDKDEPTGYYLAECYFDYEMIGDDQIRVWYNGNNDEMGNATAFFSTTGGRMAYGVLPFGNSEASPRTFLVETDNIREPTYLKLTDQNTPNNIMTLVAEAVSYPFGDGPDN